MYLRTILLGSLAIATCACSSAVNLGGGAVYSAKDGSGDSAVGGDAGKSDVSDAISDVKAGDIKGSDVQTTDSSKDGADVVDAGVTPEMIQKCWQDNCSSQMSACQNQPTCSSVLQCVFACPKTDSVCPNKCADPLKNDLAALGVFDGLAKCTKANCNLSNLPPNTCGNGKCEGDENTWCSLDCDTTIGPLSDCVTGKCQVNADPCLLDETCNKALNCVLECTDPSCWSGCAPAGGQSLNWFNGVWNCAQVDCGVYLPQGSP
jgi:hypothetical protein